MTFHVHLWLIMKILVIKCKTFSLYKISQADTEQPNYIGRIQYMRFSELHRLRVIALNQYSHKT